MTVWTTSEEMECTRVERSSSGSQPRATVSRREVTFGGSADGGREVYSSA